MSGDECHTPLLNTNLLERHSAAFNQSRDQFVGATLGYPNTELGRRRLDAWIDAGTGFDKVLKQIEIVKPDIAGYLRAAITRTEECKAAEAQAELFEQGKAETGFTPYIQVLGTQRMPNPMYSFAFTGGRSNFIEIPREIIALPVEKQLNDVLPSSMKSYLLKYKGLCPLSGV